MKLLILFQKLLTITQIILLIGLIRHCLFCCEMLWVSRAFILVLMDVISSFISTKEIIII